MMSELPALINDLALILVVAAVVTVVFKKLRQPLVLGYIVAGFLVSPRMPYIPTVLESREIQTWADIGVVFLLFSMGLDFSVKRIAKLGLSPFIAVGVILVSMGCVGFMAGKAFGWSPMDCVFLAAILSVCSSTTIIYKTFTDLKLRQKAFANLVLSVLVLEDVLSIVIMVALTAVSSGGEVSGAEIGLIVLRIVFFIVLWFVAGIFLIPLLLRRLRNLLSNEMLLIISLGLCFFMVIVSTKVGFSSSFGAFVMGTIIAETVEGSEVARLVDPLKDLFGAVFFVSVGMLVDVQVIIQYALPILLIVLFVILGQAIFGTTAFLVSGQPLKTALHCSFSMAQIGEFPFIIASMGLSLGVIDNFIYPVIVASSAITIFLTPYVLKSAPYVYDRISARLPQRWQERLDRMEIARESTDHAQMWRELLLRTGRTLLVYGILSTAFIAVGHQLLMPWLLTLLPPAWAQLASLVLVIVSIAAFVRAVALMPKADALGRRLWTEALTNRLPILLLWLLRFAIALLLLAVPIGWEEWLPMWATLLLALGVLALITFSRKLARRNKVMEQVFVDNLNSKEHVAVVKGVNKPAYASVLLDHNLRVSDLTLPENSRWIGKTLSELSLRTRFGIHVSSILRGKRRINIPYGSTPLYPLDQLQVIGTDEQLAAIDAAMAEEVHRRDTPIEQQAMQLRMLRVMTGSPLEGKTLEESGLTSRFKCMVVGLERNNIHLTEVMATTRFADGDIVWVVGEPAALKKLEAEGIKCRKN